MNYEGPFYGGSFLQIPQQPAKRGRSIFIQPTVVAVGQNARLRTALLPREKTLWERGGQVAGFELGLAGGFLGHMGEGMRSEMRCERPDCCWCAMETGREMSDIRFT